MDLLLQRPNQFSLTDAQDILTNIQQRACISAKGTRQQRQRRRQHLIQTLVGRQFNELVQQDEIGRFLLKNVFSVSQWSIHLYTHTYWLSETKSTMSQSVIRSANNLNR